MEWNKRMNQTSAWTGFVDNITPNDGKIFQIDRRERGLLFVHLFANVRKPHIRR